MWKKPELIVWQLQLELLMEYTKENHIWNLNF